MTTVTTGAPAPAVSSAAWPALLLNGGRRTR